MSKTGFPTPFPGATVESFARAASRAGFALDDAQRAAIVRLLSPESRHVYLHGPAGRGKTWLMDVAISASTAPGAKRVHFHEFFLDLHAAIVRHAFRLDDALDELTAGVSLLCFDEFHVHDRADAVLIERLLQALVERDCAVVVTSNYAPEGLLPNPYFHAAFEPAIALIRREFEVVSVDGGVDHRARRSAGRPRSGFAAGAWVVGGAASDDVRTPRDTAEVGARVVALQALTDDGLEADFDELCERPLATREYVGLAALRRRWIIRRVPPLENLSAAGAQRLANLVDVAADRDVEVTFHASGPAAALADADVPPLDLPRTLSRLGSLRQL